MRELASLRRHLANSTRHALLIAGLLANLSCLPALASAAEGPDEPADKPVTSPVDPQAVVARLNDDSVLKMTLADEEIAINTRYGTLRIAPADIQKIDFALRLPAEMQQQIDKAIADLASVDEQTRTEAAARLNSFGHLAYPALLKAADAPNSRAGKEAARLIDDIADTVDPQEIKPRTADVIQTADATIAGQLVAPTLKVRTTQFGELSLKVADARSLRSQSLPEEKPAPADEDALPAPASLMQYQDQIGRTLKFRVTGGLQGAIWGTDVYTADSSLAAAVVHAGVLKIGQTGVVRVKIVVGLPAFAGAQRHGIASHDFGPYPVAYQILTKRRR